MWIPPPLIVVYSHLTFSISPAKTSIFSPKKPLLPTITSTFLGFSFSFPCQDFSRYYGFLRLCLCLSVYFWPFTEISSSKRSCCTDTWINSYTCWKHQIQETLSTKNLCFFFLICKFPEKNWLLHYFTSIFNPSILPSFSTMYSFLSVFPSFLLYFFPPTLSFHVLAVMYLALSSVSRLTFAFFIYFVSTWSNFDFASLIPFQIWVIALSHGHWIPV